MSIALSIVDLAIDQARKAEASAVKEVELDIGTLSGIEIEALNLALEMAVKDTFLENAGIRINRISAVCECLECGKIFDAEGIINQCPVCRELNTTLIRGKELQVKSILIE